MKRIFGDNAAALAAVAFLLLTGAISGAACSQGVERQEEGLNSAPPGQEVTEGASVTLQVRVINEHAIALRSPTFRCGPDYCGSAVLLGLGEILGSGTFDWNTDMVPGEEYVELRINFDPNALSPSQVVGAVVQAMQRYPDPKYPGPVEVVYESGR